VTLDFRVLPEGSVDDVRPVPRLGDTDDRAIVDRAQSIAQRCIYQPAMRDGEPVAARVQKLFSFTRS
jgi:hypothetical protein